MNQLKGRTISAHNVRILFWATVFASVNFMEPILTLFYLERGLDLAQVYMVTLVWCLTVLVFEVPTGAYADRFGPKASFVTGCLIAILSKVILIFAHDFWGMAVYTFLWGLSVTFFSGAEEALLYESLKQDGEEERMSDVMGKLYAASLYPMVLAFLFGAYVARDLEESQFVLLIVLGMVFQLVQLFFLLRVVNPRSFEGFRENPFQHVKNGVTVIRKTPDLLLIFLNFTIVFVLSAVVAGRLEQPYLTMSGVPVVWLGVLYAGAAVLALLVSSRIGWFTQRFSKKGLMYATGLATALALGVAATAVPAVWTATLVFLILRLSRAVRMPLYSQLTNDHIPSESRATTLSLLSIADSLFDVIFLVTFAGIAVAADRYALVFAACAGIVLLGTLIPVREAKKG